VLTGGSAKVTLIYNAVTDSMPENSALRQQLIVLQRQVRGRVRFTNNDRLFFVQLYRWFPSILKAIKIIRRSPKPSSSAIASSRFTDRLCATADVIPSCFDPPR